MRFNPFIPSLFELQSLYLLLVSDSTPRFTPHLRFTLYIYSSIQFQYNALSTFLVPISLLTPHLRSNPVIHSFFEPPPLTFCPVPSSPLSRRPGQPQPPGAARRHHQGLGAQPRGSRRCPRWGGEAELGVRQLSLRAPTPSEWPQDQTPTLMGLCLSPLSPPPRMGTPGWLHSLTCCCWGAGGFGALGRSPGGDRDVSPAWGRRGIGDGIGKWGPGQ